MLLFGKGMQEHVKPACLDKRKYFLSHFPRGFLRKQQPDQLSLRLGQWRVCVWKVEVCLKQVGSLSLKILSLITHLHRSPAGSQAYTYNTGINWVSFSFRHVDMGHISCLTNSCLCVCRCNQQWSLLHDDDDDEDGLFSSYAWLHVRVVRVVTLNDDFSSCRAESGSVARCPQSETAVQSKLDVSRWSLSLRDVTPRIKGKAKYTQVIFSFWSETVRTSAAVHTHPLWCSLTLHLRGRYCTFYFTLITDTCLIADGDFTVHDFIYTVEDPNMREGLKRKTNAHVHKLIQWSINRIFSQSLSCMWVSGRKRNLTSPPVSEWVGLE